MNDGLIMQLANATISGIYTVRRDGDLSLSDLPRGPLAKILGLVGSVSFNRPPEYDTFLRSRSRAHYETNSDDPNYAVKNLMALRRVSSQFEEIINNEMVPGDDYDFVNVDVKVKGTPNSRTCTFYKYGGTGSMRPATRLSRVRRFNETDYTHVEKFERIRSLCVTDFVLNEELLETILRLDLRAARFVRFDRIVGVNFNGMDVPTVINHFLGTIDSTAPVYFHSNVFDPNVVLFGGVQGEGSVPSEEPVEKRHKAIRKERGWLGDRDLSLPFVKKETKRFRAYRNINIVSQSLFHERHNIDYDTPGASEKLEKKKLKNQVERVAAKKGPAMKKAANWHLRKVLKLLGKHHVRARNSVYFHLKQLKKITGLWPMLTAEEMAIVDNMNEEKKRDSLMAHFPFLSKLQNSRINT